MNKTIFGVVFVLASNVGQPAFAYLDPGTGSMILQLLLGGVAGALVIGKLYWHRLKEFLGIKTPVVAPSDSSEDDPESR